jgi:hypothetical protein
VRRSSKFEIRKYYFRLVGFYNQVAIGKRYLGKVPEFDPCNRLNISVVGIMTGHVSIQMPNITLHFDATIRAIIPLMSAFRVAVGINNTRFASATIKEAPIPKSFRSPKKTSYPKTRCAENRYLKEFSSRYFAHFEFT